MVTKYLHRSRYKLASSPSYGSDIVFQLLCAREQETSTSRFDCHCKRLRVKRKSFENEKLLNFITSIGCVQHRVRSQNCPKTKFANRGSVCVTTVFKTTQDKVLLVSHLSTKYIASGVWFGTRLPCFSYSHWNRSKNHKNDNKITAITAEVAWFAVSLRNACDPTMPKGTVSRHRLVSFTSAAQPLSSVALLRLWTKGCSACAPPAARASVPLCCPFYGFRRQNALERPILLPQSCRTTK